MGHAMVKSRGFPSRVLKNRGIEVTGWKNWVLCYPVTAGIGHGMEELGFLLSRDCGHGHAMAKSLEFPSRVLKNREIEVTGWHETGLMPSRDYYSCHGMEKIEVLPSCALYIGDTWVTRWIDTGQFHRLTLCIQLLHIRRGLESHKQFIRLTLHPTSYMRGRKYSPRSPSASKNRHGTNGSGRKRSLKALSAIVFCHAGEDQHCLFDHRSRRSDSRRAAIRHRRLRERIQHQKRLDRTIKLTQQHADNTRG